MRADSPTPQVNIHSFTAGLERIRAVWRGHSVARYTSNVDDPQQQIRWTVAWALSHGSLSSEASDCLESLKREQTAPVHPPLETSVHESDVAGWEKRLRGLQEDLGIDLVAFRDGRYPPLLREGLLAPPLLFMMGRSLLAQRKPVAIVGSRDVSTQISRDTEALAAMLAARGHCIVSGLAEGTDTAAHQGALSEASGATVAVLPSGIQDIFPESNRALAEEIGERGLLLSEFLPWDQARRSYFLQRNATISALSLVSFVMAAGQRSGSRSEINHAVRNGREVFLWRAGIGDQPWALRMVSEGLATFVDSLDEAAERAERAFHA